MSQHSSYEYNTGFEKIKRLFDFDQAKNLKILDVACGDGRISRELIKKGHQVYGVDNDPKAIIAAGLNGLDCRQSDIEHSLPFEDGLFDVVLALDILEHLNDPKKFLMSLKLKLKANGQLIISIPNHFDLRNRIRILAGEGIIHWAHKNFPNANSWHYPHIRFFRLVELADLLAEVGLYINAAQFNFMAGGLIPRRLTPPFLRIMMLKMWPTLLSGKFVIRCGLKTNQEKKKIFLAKTPKEF